MAWPMCSLPVTFGGGMGSVKGGPVASGSGAKNPLCSHLWAVQHYHSAAVNYYKVSNTTVQQ